jgi:hypothetical protein
MARSGTVIPQEIRQSARIPAAEVIPDDGATELLYSTSSMFVGSDTKVVLGQFGKEEPGGKGLFPSAPRDNHRQICLKSDFRTIHPRGCRRGFPRRSTFVRSCYRSHVGRNYSYLKATMGSTRAARRPGI